MISDIAFNSKYADKEFLEYKVFSTIHFFTDYFGSFGNTDTIYYLIGKLREYQITGNLDNDIIRKIEEEMRKRIQFILSTVLEMPNPTLLDAIQYFNQDRYPIYLMNQYDIQKLGNELKDTNPRIEKFENNKTIAKSELRKKEATNKKILKLLSKMSEEGCNICFDYSSGPFTENDYKIVQKIKQFK